MLINATREFGKKKETWQSDTLVTTIASFSTCKMLQ